MPLTQAEALELQELELEEQSLLGQLQQPAGGLTPDEEIELAQLEQEEAQIQNVLSPPPQQIKPVKKDPLDEARRAPEAQLGAGRRLVFSLEPLRSNRKAFLIQEFGEENVFEDPNSGDLFLNQGGKIRPVNQEGISAADLAELAGTAPEILGGFIGGAGGFAAGSVPGAIAGGAAGGAAGSAIRQAASAALTDVPQVATPEERAAELGLSTALGAVGGGVSQAVGKGIKLVFPKVSKMGLKLKDIVKEEDISVLTRAQKTGGKAAEQEKVLAEFPVFGKFVRKKLNTQIDKAKTNLKNVAGDFIELDSTRESAGFNVKQLARNVRGGVKKESAQLFKEIAEKGDNLIIDSSDAFKSLNNSIGDFKLFDKAGKKLPWDADTGLEEESFNRLQRVVGKTLETLRKPDVTAKTLIRLRETIDDSIKNKDFTRADRILIEIRKNLMDVTGSILEQTESGLAETYKQARALWVKQLKFDKFIKKNIDNVQDRKIVQKVFGDTRLVDEMKEIVGEDTVDEMGKQFVFDLLKSKTGVEGRVAGQSAFRLINEQHREVLEKALKPKDFKTLTNNLEFLRQTGESVNPSKSGIFNLISSPLRAVEGALLQSQRQAGKAIRKLGPEVSRAAAIMGGQKSKRRIGEKAR